MPPTLVSSSVSGPITAPKAPVRRKRAPPAPSATPASAASASTSVAPPTPPTTQHTDTPVSNAERADESTFTTTHAEQARARLPHAGTQQDQHSAVRDQQPTSEQREAQPTIEEQRPASNSEALQGHDANLPDTTLPPQSAKRKANTRGAATAPTRPPKRAKRSSARSNALVQTQINEDEAPAHPQVGPVDTPQTPASTASNEQREATITTRTRQPPKRKAPRKSAPKSAATVVNSDDEHEPETETQQEEEEEEVEDRPRKRRNTSSKVKPRRRKTPRQTRTPAESGTEVENGGEGQNVDEDSESDPELHEIDPQQVTMLGISHDKKRGKTSERERKMAAIDWNEVARKRFEELEAAAAAAAAGTTDVPTQPVDVRETTEGPSGTAESRNSTANETPAPTNNEDLEDGPSAFRIVDGQIVADDSQLVIDRHAQAQEEAAETGVAVVEENDLTRRVNQMTWINGRKRDIADRVPLSRKTDPWSEEDTERFYDALRRFGTDFYIISKMFHPRTRKQVKSKFNREEKLDGARITAALLGKVTGPTMNGSSDARVAAAAKANNAESYNLEFYAEQTGRDMAHYTKYEGLEDVERAIRDSMKEKEAAMHEAIREDNEAQASLKAAEAMKEKGKKKREPRGKGKKKKVGGGGIGGADDEE